MKDAIRNVLNRVTRPSVEGRRRRFVATVLFSATAAGSIPVIAALQSDAISDVRGAPGSFWLSGEDKAQVVLAATGGQLASLALATEADAPAVLDVVDTGSLVLMHDRTSGKVTVVDGIEGKLGREFDQPKVVSTDAEPALVGAGEFVFLADRASDTVHRLGVDPESNQPAVLNSVSTGTFDQWVGTSDGLLWLLDTPTGELTTIDGERVTKADFSKPGLDLVLSALGGDPVILDRTTGRLRWPKAAESMAVEGFSGSALLQQPTAGGPCIVVMLPDAARCYDTRGEVRSMPVTVGLPDFVAAQVFANDENIVVASPSAAEVALGSWPGTTWSSAIRDDVSGRALLGHFTPGALLVDDPGSRYALTADRGEIERLDKFNQRTVILSADGVAAGAGVAAAEGDGGSGEGSGDEVIGEGQVFDDKRGPDPRDDTAVTRVKRKKLIDVLANDFPRNAALAVKSVQVDSGEGVADVIDGTSVLFSPEGNLPGQAELTYIVTDAAGRTGSARVFIDIVGNEQNTDPKLVADEATVASGVDISIDVLANDTDDEGDPLSITKVGNPAHGSASINESDQISYESEPGFAGADTFIYEVKDGYGGTAQTTVTVTVTPGNADNRPPNPSPDRATVTAGQTVQVDALANDSDPDGDVLRPVDVSVPSSSKLTASLLPSGQVSIAAAIDAPAGLVQVTYSIADTAVPPNRVQSTIAVVVVSATDVNRPPLAVNDSAVVTENTPRLINLTGNDSDPDGDLLTITSLDLERLDRNVGSVRQVSQSSIEFTPAAGARGTTTFDYSVSDNNKGSDTATVTVQVVPSSNSGPVARDDILTVFGGDPVTIPVLANDFHPDGLALALAGQPSFSVGLVTVNDDQSLTFTPPSADPRTYTFSYTVKDSDGRTATAKVVVTVDKVSTKSSPVAVNDQASTVFGASKLIDVLANDVDPDGQAIDLVSVTQPVNGATTITANGQIRYAPPAVFSGLATFTYTIEDVDGNQASATVVVQVQPPAKLAPTARDDLTSMLTNAVVLVDVLSNDSDPDGPASALTLSPTVLAPANIGATVVGGKLRITSTGVAGTYTVPYTVTDGDNLSASGKLTVIVTTPANQPPVASADSASTPYGQEVLIAVLGNDTDPEGGQLSLGNVTAPVDESTGASAGSVSKVGNSVRYNPGSYPGGAAVFTYVVVDNGERTAVGTVRVVVNPCSATPPVTVPDNVTTSRDQTINIKILNNDGPTTIRDVSITDPTSGARNRLLPDNTVDFMAPNVAGTYTFTYTVTNTCGATGSAKVTVTVNRAPTPQPDTVTTDVGGQTIRLDVLRNDSDPDGDALTITKVTPDGAANIVAGGKELSFRPSSTVGPVSFTYTVADCTVTGCIPATATATVVVNVIQPNRPPVAVDDTGTMPQGTSSLLVNVLTNDTDPDRDTLILTNGLAMVSPVNGATLTKEGNSVRFTPTNPCTTGTYTFVYWLTDGQGDASGDQGQVVVTITAVTNQPPTAGNDEGFTTAADTALVIPVATLLANDSDPNTCDSPLNITLGSATGGSVSLASGSVTFTPTPGSPGGSASFTYSLNDGKGGTSGIATVSITVSPPPTTTTLPPTTTTPPPTTAPPATTAPAPTAATSGTTAPP